MIVMEKRNENPKIHVVTRSGALIGADNFHGTSNVIDGLNGAKKTCGLWVRKSVVRQPSFEPKKEKHVFMQAINNF